MTVFSQAVGRRYYSGSGGEEQRSMNALSRRPVPGVRKNLIRGGCSSAASDGKGAWKHGGEGSCERGGRHSPPPPPSAVPLPRSAGEEPTRHRCDVQLRFPVLERPSNAHCLKSAYVAESPLSQRAVTPPGCASP